MKVTECFPIEGYTVVGFDEPVHLRYQTLEVDGNTYQTVPAFDIGPRVAIEGVHDFTGMEAALR
ncbi:MAG: hypothetical protein ACI3U8_02305 [Candidatus Onthomonas sp.]